MFAHFFFLGVCASVLPAADLEALLVRPSRSVLDAAEAALGDVCLLGVPVCERALPADDLEDFPVFLLVNVLDALLEALFPVVFLFISISSNLQTGTKGMFFAQLRTQLRDS